MNEEHAQQSLTALRSVCASTAIMLQERAALEDQGGKNYSLLSEAAHTYVLGLEALLRRVYQPMLEGTLFEDYDAATALLGDIRQALERTPSGA